MTGAESASASPPSPPTAAAKASRLTMNGGWSTLPSNILGRILTHLDRDDVARSSSVCRHWYAFITSQPFHRAYRKHLRTNPMPWFWLVSCSESSSEPDHHHLSMLAWNLHLRRRFKLTQVDSCRAASRSHPKSCWFDFTSADDHIAWACRHTPTSVCCARPLNPSSRHSLLLPPFPEPVVYEFRLGLLLDRDTAGQSTGYRLTVLRLGWPHSESNATSVTLTASVYRSASGRWETQHAKVKQELKRWGSSVVSRNHFYVLMRPANEHGPMTGLLGYRIVGEAGEVWSHLELPLPDTVRYSWRTKMDLIDRAGFLMLVTFEMEEAVLRVYQAEEVGFSRTVRQRWSPVTAMQAGTCRRFCEALGEVERYRCRGFGDFIFFSGPASGLGFVFWIPRRSWHQVDLSAFSGDDDARYMFALQA